MATKPVAKDTRKKVVIIGGGAAGMVRPRPLESILTILTLRHSPVQPR